MLLGTDGYLPKAGRGVLAEALLCSYVVIQGCP